MDAADVDKTRLPMAKRSGMTRLNYGRPEMLEQSLIPPMASWKTHSNSRLSKTQSMIR